MKLRHKTIISSGRSNAREYVVSLQSHIELSGLLRADDPRQDYMRRRDQVREAIFRAIYQDVINPNIAKKIAGLPSADKPGGTFVDRKARQSATIECNTEYKEHRPHASAEAVLIMENDIEAEYKLVHTIPINQGNALLGAAGHIADAIAQTLIGSLDNQYLNKMKSETVSEYKVGDDGSCEYVIADVEPGEKQN